MDKLSEILYDYSRNYFRNQDDLERLVGPVEASGSEGFRILLAMAKMSKADYRGAIDIVASTTGVPFAESGQLLLYRIWGDALIALAEQTDHSAAKIELLQEAARKYAEIIRIKPDQHQVLYNWSVALGRLAALHDGADREALLEEAARKYARAMEIEPGRHEGFNDPANGFAGPAGVGQGPDGGPGW